MTPEAKFKSQLKKRWDKSYPKTEKRASWTAVPGVKGFPDVHVSIPGISGLLELKVHPNGLNKNQQHLVPKLSYGSNIFVLTQYKSPLGWQEDTIKVVYWHDGVPTTQAESIRWVTVAQPQFWQDLLHGNI